MIHNKQCCTIAVSSGGFDEASLASYKAATSKSFYTFLYTERFHHAKLSACMGFILQFLYMQAIET